MPPGSLRSLGFVEVADEVVAASPLRGRLVLLLGPEPVTRRVGRSMATDPTVRFADVPTDLFDRGLARIVGSYLSSLAPGPGQGTGLVAVFDPPALLVHLRRLGDDLLDEVRQGAATLVDHGDGLGRWRELIALLYPDAELIEVAPGSRASGFVDALRRVLHLPGRRARRERR